MCGICGIIYHHDRRAEKELLKKMTDTLHHRGPDNHGVYTDANLGLGHTRLSILDTSPKGHQPMHTGHGHSIVFNGEIYNFKELKQSIATHCTFKSDSDTEVLLQGLAMHGPSFLDKIEGMFAFAFWDANTQTLLLARDRMGQKPLYYVALPDRFIFASEPQAILQDPDFTARPDLNTLFHYLSVQSCPAPHCAFQNMAKLEPAQALELRNGQIRVWNYWQPDFSRQQHIPETEAIDIFIEKLRTSVSRCLVSDVPLGLFLSGGVDSSLVSALASEISPNRLQSFTIGFGESRYDERKYAQQVADHCGLDHHELIVEPDLNIIDTIVGRYGEPFADSSALPTGYLAEFTRRHVTVALSGDGGDDLFGGYERHLNPYLYPTYSSLSLKKQEEFNRDIHYISGREKGINHAEIREKLLGTGLLFYYRYWARFYGKFKQQLCTPEFAKVANPQLSVDLFLNAAKVSQLSDINKIISFELKYYLASTLMSKVDIMSMTHSLEVRAPLLELPVVEFACSLPDSYKVHPAGNLQYTAKYLVKKAAERYLPREIIYRPKMGFGVPIGDWMRNEFKEYMYDTLLAPEAIERGYFNRDFIKQLLDKHMAGTNYHYLLWTLLMLELWHQKYID